MRRIWTAREQVELLSPWLHEAAFIMQARYPQEWRDEAPYGRFPSGRARNRPPSVLRDPDDPNSEVIDPSEISYKYEDDYDGGSVSAYHPNGAHLGNYSWEGFNDDLHPPHIAVAQVDPKYQAQGVSGAIIDHIRENYEPNLVHSGYRGRGSLSYQGRAGALRDRGGTAEEHSDYFNTTPYNYGESRPVRFNSEFSDFTEAQRKAHNELMEQFEEDKKHPNFTGRTSRPRNPDMHDEYGDRHEYGYDSYGDYVGLSDGGKNSQGYSEEGYDENGLNAEGLNREGQTRHGYTPGDGTPPEGTVPMSQMAAHWEQNGLSPTSEDHQEMMKNAEYPGDSPTMYAVRQPGQRSPHSWDYHVGNGDTLYSSLDRARQVAFHPDDPRKDRDIVSVRGLNPDYLHTDASGKSPEDFHYAPVSGEYDADVTASTPADNVVHDPQRHQRILGDLGPGWSQGNLPYSDLPSFEYADQNSGRSGRMHQQRSSGLWSTEHQPQFGSPRQGQYDNYRDAADAIWAGTRLGPTMEQHALEVNNDFLGTGGGEVEWEPHPNGQGLMSHTPHGDLHVIQSPDSGLWNWIAGPHGHQPGDEGGMRSSTYRLSPSSAATQAIERITSSPFHGGLADELGEGWRPHPSSPSAYSRRLPSGNHAFVSPHDDGGYRSGIQPDDGGGPFVRHSPDLAQAKAFINHRENPVPASELGEGWEDYDRGPRHFPTYVHESHPSGAWGTVSWANDGGWRGGVDHGGESYRSSKVGTPGYETPHEAATWANRVMDELGNK